MKKLKLKGSIRIPSISMKLGDKLRIRKPSLGLGKGLGKIKL